MHGSDCPKCGASGQSDKTCSSCGAVCAPSQPFSSFTSLLSTMQHVVSPSKLIGNTVLPQLNDLISQPRHLDVTTPTRL
ncbi:hypothetical protein BDZ45DRAFT_298773 [Acephala macrosclerotiorum]|nr:hypothetical protein BDZ45DRAFT_298773 [Acephala macrosclerotiorum]